MSKLLVVVPPGKPKLSPKKLRAAVYEFMGTKPLPPSVKVAKTVAPRATRAVGELLDYFSESETVLHQRVDEHVDLLADLLSRVLRQHRDRSLPGLRVEVRGSKRLSDLKPSTARFVESEVYVAHPWRPDFFIPLATFHAYLAAEKSAEFQLLCSSLGARSVRIADVKARQAGVSGGAEAVVPVEVPLDVELSAGATWVDKDVFSVQFATDFPGERPQLPENLCWYHHEPQWQAMARVRLDRWITSYKAELRSSQTFDVDVGLALKVEGVGFGLGGKYHENQDLSVSHDIDFFPRSAYGA